MRLFTISGRAGSGKSRRAQELYDFHAKLGWSTAMIDPGSYGETYSDLRARKNPDIKIITQLTTGDLHETIEDGK